MNTPTTPSPKDMQENGSRWTMLNGRTPWWEAAFWSWGALEIVPVPNTNQALRSGGVFMLRFPDGWRYAHVDGQTSAYCAAESLGQLPNGECAWLLHEQRNAALYVKGAERQLAEAQTLFLDAQNAFALAIYKANRNQPDPDQGQPDPTN